VNARALAHRAWIWGPVAGYLGLIFYISSRPHVGWARDYPDLLLHAIEYLVLSLLLARALNEGLRLPVPGRRLLLAWVLCVVYAVSDEIHQSFVPRRSSDWRDVAADAAGAAAGLGAIAAAGRLRREREPA
jgi:VanZ family protein